MSKLFDGNILVEFALCMIIIFFSAMVILDYESREKQLHKQLIESGAAYYDAKTGDFMIKGCKE